jgi:Zn-finger nucleic acid-binding protein
MQCPVDGEQLVMAERSGVEIDYCPRCRGVWLDRGELDKIVERGSALAAPPVAAAAPPPRHDDRPRHAGETRGYDDDDDRRRHPSSDSSRKRKSFLGDIFDF